MVRLPKLFVEGNPFGAFDMWGLDASDLRYRTGLRRQVKLGLKGVVYLNLNFAHGTYNVMDGMQGMANALDGTNHAGPFAQFGGALFGPNGYSVGESMDAVLSVRGYLKAGAGFFGNLTTGDVSLGDIQSVADASKKYFDTHNVSYCPSSD